GYTLDPATFPPGSLSAEGSDIVTPGTGSTISVINGTVNNGTPNPGTKGPGPITTANYSTARQGVTLNLDNTTPQIFHFGSFTFSQQLATRHETFVGSKFGDHVTVKPLVGVRRSIVGGGHAAGQSDVLDFDAQGKAVVITATTITASGFAPVTFTDMQQV